MESGVVPPPARRSAPRSLVGGAKDARRQSEPDNLQLGGSARAAASDSAGSAPTAREQRLEEMLNAEANENRRLQAALREQASKFERSLQHQSQLEEDVVSRDSRIKLLSEELRVLKNKKHSADTELAQSQKDYMNGQARWLEQVDQLNDEIQVLRARLNESKFVASGLEKELAEFREKEKRREAEERKKAAKAAAPDHNIQVAANSLEKHQNELLIKELRSRHSQIVAEITEIKAVNERLREDNENFQYLLVERTVSGDLTTPNGSNGPSGLNGSNGANGVNDAAASAAASAAGGGAGGHTLADEEVFEFDAAAGGEPRHDADTNSPSLADEGNDEQSSSMTPTSEVSGTEKSAEFLQKTINKQQFELQSLRNHNRALKLSLERLVDRLLDNKTFSQAVEEAVSTNIVQRFRQRLASSTIELDRRMGTNPNRGGEGMGPSAGMSAAPSASASSSQLPASAWSNMIFNTQYSGTPNRRVISLGVDSEYRPAASPIHSHHPGSAARSASGSQSSIDGLRPLCRVNNNQFGWHSNASSSSIQSSESPQSTIQVAKRTDNQSSLRKLRLRD